MEKDYIRFARLISGLGKEIGKIETRAIQEFGLKKIHAICLYNIFAEEGKFVSATDICKQSHEDKAAVSRAIGELEKRGLIVQAFDRNNYRARLGLTEEGKAVAEKLCQIFFCAAQTAGDSLSETEKAQLLDALEKISDGLKASQH